MLPEARIEHHVAGRLRLRIPAMRGDDEYFLRLRNELSGLDAAGPVSVTPRTGSVLFEDTTLRPEALARVARQRGWFVMTQRRRGALAMPLLPQTLAGLFRGSSATPSLVAILVALAILQTARGQFMVPAFSFLMFAFELVRKEQADTRPPEPPRPSTARALH